MIISYEEFCDLLVKHIQEGEDFYINPKLLMRRY